MWARRSGWRRSMRQRPRAASFSSAIREAAVRVRRAARVRGDAPARGARAVCVCRAVARFGKRTRDFRNPPLPDLRQPCRHPDSSLGRQTGRNWRDIPLSPPFDWSRSAGGSWLWHRSAYRRRFAPHSQHTPRPSPGAALDPGAALEVWRPQSAQVWGSPAKRLRAAARGAPRAWPEPRLWAPSAARMRGRPRGYRPHSWRPRSRRPQPAGRLKSTGARQYPCA
jgi:hypothetical protein